MAKNKTNGSGRTIVNMSCLVAIVIAIVIFLLQIINHYAQWDFLSKVNHYLVIIKEFILTLVVFLCGLSYALSINKKDTRTILIVLCVVFLVLFIIGIVIL